MTIFPQDSTHRLVGPDLATFFERVSERVIALGSGAYARVRAGRYEDQVRNLPDLVDTIDAARAISQGREDLEVRLWGDTTDSFGRFLGARTLECKFFAFVSPHTLLDAHLCLACGWPRDYDGTRKDSGCVRPGCEDDVASDEELRSCWSFRLYGVGPDGIGERFVEEGRRLRGTPFFEALEGACRARLFEWQAWS